MMIRTEHIRNERYTNPALISLFFFELLRDLVSRFFFFRHIFVTRENYSRDERESLTRTLQNSVIRAYLSSSLATL